MVVGGSREGNSVVLSAFDRARTYPWWVHWPAGTARTNGSICAHAVSDIVGRGSSEAPVARSRGALQRRRTNVRPQTLCLRSPFGAGLRPSALPWRCRRIPASRGAIRP